MTREIEIRDKKTGQVLRETYIPNVPTFFGSLNLTPRDIMLISSVAVSIVTFFVTNLNDKKLMQQNLSELKQTTSRLTDFRDNSDAFWGQTYGTKFKNGEPVDNNFKIHNRGNINKEST